MKYLLLSCGFVFILQAVELTQQATTITDTIVHEFLKQRTLNDQQQNVMQDPWWAFFTPVEGVTISSHYKETCISVDLEFFKEHSQNPQSELAKILLTSALQHYRLKERRLRPWEHVLKYMCFMTPNSFEYQRQDERFESEESVKLDECTEMLKPELVENGTIFYFSMLLGHEKFRKIVDSYRESHKIKNKLTPEEQQKVFTLAKRLSTLPPNKPGASCEDSDTWIGPTVEELEYDSLEQELFEMRQRGMY
ncbi:MAG: hypothetical protein K2X90_01795 [Candidatus Babeliaceae bacterium]|nr:hypothetical protein [Candidatus Babeliaceae bacterium]